MTGKPPADIAFAAALVRTLLAEQHPDLASLALTEIGEGWNNRVFRLACTRLGAGLRPRVSDELAG